MTAAKFQEHADRVYFIQNRESRLIKIGTTTAFRDRMNSLSCGGKNTQCELLAHRPGGRDLEKALHKKLVKHRKRGEWFYPHEDVLACVADARRFPQSHPRGPIKNGKTYHMARQVERRWSMDPETAMWIANDRLDIAHLLYRSCIHKEVVETVIDNAVIDFIGRSDEAWLSA